MTEKIIAVFDIGKTNKKLILFNADLEIVKLESLQISEGIDDDGYPAENLQMLTNWMDEMVADLTAQSEFQIEALNFATYGASLVNLDKQGRIATPFYNYLKPLDEHILQTFFDHHGDAKEISLSTASPIMGLLNSGLQLYYLKNGKPDLFKNICHVLHFPQYFCFHFTNKYCAELTSIGSHTLLWDYLKQDYHAWVKNEGLLTLLPEIQRNDVTFPLVNAKYPIKVGVGMHDSSAALYTYQRVFKQPFILISTGTWSICLNAFNSNPLTPELLQKDCLNFMDFEGKQVRASRLFLGKEFEYQYNLIKEYFQVDDKETNPYQYDQLEKPMEIRRDKFRFQFKYIKPEVYGFKNNLVFDITVFKNFTQAYYNLMDEITDLQVASFHLVLGKINIKSVYIDGGFNNNKLFVSMMARKLPHFQIYATNLAQGTALGAALMVSPREVNEEVMENHLAFERISPA